MRLVVKFIEDMVVCSEHLGDARPEFSSTAIASKRHDLLFSIIVAPVKVENDNMAFGSESVNHLTDHSLILFIEVGKPFHVSGCSFGFNTEPGTCSHGNTNSSHNTFSGGESIKVVKH
jgi:hypothetical protein